MLVARFLRSLDLSLGQQSRVYPTRDIADFGPRVFFVGEFLDLLPPLIQTPIQFTREIRFDTGREIERIPRFANVTGLSLENIFLEGADIGGDYREAKTIS
jgi:hypothetical protein